MPSAPSAQANNERAFHAQLSQFRWARGNNDDSQAAANTSGGNIFSRAYNSVASTASGYIPLHSSERTNEEEAYFALGRWERSVHIYEGLRV